MEKDDIIKRESVRRRAHSKYGRILKAVILARKHSKDNDEFANRVNAILIAEKLVTMDEFGILERDKK